MTAPDKNADILELDVQNLPPPEPLERVLEALAGLAPGQRLRLLIDREPHPLYDILDARGFVYRTDFIETCYQVMIRHRPDDMD